MTAPFASWTTRVLSFSLLLGACGESEGQYIDDFAGDYCARLNTCYPAQFSQAYAQGQPECVATFTRGLTAEQLGATTNCTTAQQDQCAADIAALACGASLASSAVPASCSCS
jgi:hypothetical protein